MNLDTVLMCAKMAAAKQQAGLGYVDSEIQALIDELTPVSEAPVVEEEPSFPPEIPDEAFAAEAAPVVEAAPEVVAEVVEEAPEAPAAE